MNKNDLNLKINFTKMRLFQLIYNLEFNPNQFFFPTIKHSKDNKYRKDQKNKIEGYKIFLEK